MNSRIARRAPRSSLALLCFGLLLAAAAPAAAKPLPSTSMYRLSGAFTDQTGASVTLDVFRGQPVLIGMVYASCPSACPLLITRLKRVLADLPAESRARVKVVLVSLDPKRDTPQKLTELAKVHGLEHQRWRLLRGDDDAMREVAAVLGVRFRDDGGGLISHTSNIALLDRDGVILLQTEDLSPPPPALLESVRSLSAPGT